MTEIPNLYPSWCSSPALPSHLQRGLRPGRSDEEEGSLQVPQPGYMPVLWIHHPLEWVSQRWPHSQASLNLGLGRCTALFLGSAANGLRSYWEYISQASCCLPSFLQQVLVDRTASSRMCTQSPLLIWKPSPAQCPTPRAVPTECLSGSSPQHPIFLFCISWPLMGMRN